MMQQEWKTPLLALVSLAATVAALLSVRSSLMPILAVAGGATAVLSLSRCPVPSRRQREFLRQQQELAQKEAFLSKRQREAEQLFLTAQELHCQAESEINTLAEKYFEEVKQQAIAFGLAQLKEHEAVINQKLSQAIAMSQQATAIKQAAREILEKGNNECQALLDIQQQEYQAIVDRLQQDIQGMKMVFAKAYNAKDAELNKYLKPGYAPNESIAHSVVNTVLDFLYEQGVNLEWRQTVTEGHTFKIVLQPRNPALLADVYKRVKDLREPLISRFPNCKKAPHVEVVDRGIQLLADTSGIDYEAELAKKMEAKTKPDEPPMERFVQFFSEKAHQVAILGASGGGKTTLIGNIVGVFAADLGGEKVRLVITNPKPSQQSAKLGRAKYRNWKTAIFGLLEAAVEIQYRLNLNERAEEENPEKPDYPNHYPTIFLFDEYSQIASKWNSVTQDKFEQAIEEFRLTLDLQRQKVLEEVAQDLKPNKLAGELLKFCWQVGRSEKVKIIIAGQNLMPSILGINKIDIWNPGFVILGDLVSWGIENRAYDFQVNELKQQYRLRVELAQKEPRQGFFALFCPPREKSYFQLLPSEGAYKFDESEEAKKQLESLYQKPSSADNKSVTHPELSSCDPQPLPPVTEGANSVEAKDGLPSSDYVPPVDRRNCFPQKSSYEEIELWQELCKRIKNRQKKWAIENILGKRGRYYEEGLGYIEYLTEKYGDIEGD